MLKTVSEGIKQEKVAKA